MLLLNSRRGLVIIKATITERSQPGTIFTTYNYPETPVNYLTFDALDRLSRSPEYKLCAIKVEALNQEKPQ